MPQAKFDLIIYGASSFVGAILTRYIASQYGHGSKEFKWAIAGRSERKLQKVRGSLAPILGVDAGKLDILLADANDPEALNALCQRTRVIASTVGPYAQYGEPLVKACVENGVDYCDLTGEFQWIKRMQDTYSEQAAETQARIVHSCGFDSIPSDLGVLHMQNLAKEEFGQSLSKIEMRLHKLRGGMSGGTLASLMGIFEEIEANPSAMNKQMQDPYSTCPADHSFSQVQKQFTQAFLDTNSKQWAMPFIMADINTRAVHRSNALLGNAYGDDFEYNEAMLTGKGLLASVVAKAGALFIATFMAAASVKPIRTLLNNYLLPKPGQGPSEKAQEAGAFVMRFYGYNEQAVCLKTQVSGDKDPGYGFTARMLGDAAVSLALDYHNRGRKRWGKGGFYTPASLFGDEFMARIQREAGLEFEKL